MYKGLFCDLTIVIIYVFCMYTMLKVVFSLHKLINNNWNSVVLHMSVFILYITDYCLHLGDGKNMND